MSLYSNKVLLTRAGSWWATVSPNDVYSSTVFILLLYEIPFYEYTTIY